MADSDALRMRRSRAHKAGDHSLCKNCAALKAGRRMRAEQVSEIPASDPAKLRWLAERLAEDYAADRGNALLARELRMTLQALIPAGDKPADDDLEELFAEFSRS